MPDVFRYRYGDTNPTKVAYKNGVAVSIGDLCYIDAGDGNTIKPASALAWGTAIASPAAPSAVSAGVAVGSAFGTGNFNVTMTFTTVYGETAESAATTVAMTAGQALKVSTQALPAGATGVKVYCENAAASGTRFLLGALVGNQSQQFFAPPDTTSPAPPTGTSLGALQVTQYAFVQSYLGVNAQRWDGTNLTTGSKDGTLRVDTTGVFDFACASAAFNVGDLVGPAKDVGNALLPQTVSAVANKYLAVGRVELAGTALTTARIRLMTAKAALLGQS